MTSLLSLGRSHYSALGNGLYFVSTTVGIPVAFHFFGMFGAVIAVAAGDLPLYLVTVIGASRERVATWRQDLLTTGIFVALLGAGLVIRRALGA
jgi:hypothetical protein